MQAGTRYSFQKISEAHHSIRSSDSGRLNRRHLLVRRAAISDSDGALRRGGSFGDSSSLLEDEGMQSGWEASSSQLHEEAPPSVSWRKAFMYTAVTTAATAATCSARRMQLGDSGCRGSLPAGVCSRTQTWHVDETGRKRAATVLATKPAVQTPENTPKAAARRASGTLSACSREDAYGSAQQSSQDTACW